MVCTGNICRSPLAHQLLQTMADQAGLPVVVSSAGTYAEVGNPMHPQSVRSMQELGFEPQAHVARQLTSELLQETDLVISATEEHRSFVARTNPAAIKRSFTMLELARVAGYLSEKPEAVDAGVLQRAKTLQQKIELASRYRGYAPPAQATEDVLDPWGRDYAEYLRVAKQMQRVLIEITNWWGPANDSNEHDFSK